MTKKIFIDPRLQVKKSKIENAGYGVFASDDINKNTIIERAHGLKINRKHRDGSIINYDYNLDPKNTFVVFGYGSIYNHSDTPNIEHVLDKNNDTPNMTYRTTRPIEAGEELYVSYGKNWMKEHGFGN